MLVEQYVEHLALEVAKGQSSEEVDHRLWAFRKHITDLSVFPDDMLEIFAVEADEMRSVISYRLLQFDIHVGFDASDTVIIRYVD